MQAWQIALAAALPAAAACSLLPLAIYFFCKHGCKRRINQDTSNDKSEGSFSEKIKILRLGTTRDPSDSSLKQSNRIASVWRATYPIKAFNWSDHPALVAEAVEHGWATFAFSFAHLASTVPSRLFDLCMGCSQSELLEPEISWEVGTGSDYMQKIRLNPGLSRRKESGIDMVQALQTALPLPGPPLGALSFPQEAYFEITILGEREDFHADLSQNSFNDNEHAKLIPARMSMGLSSDLSSVYEHESYERRVEVKRSSEAAATEKSEQKNGEAELESTGALSEQFQLQICAVGLSAGDAPPFRLPGYDAGSVGFLSNGRVLLNGQEESERGEIAKRRKKRGWGKMKTTIIGCGYDPDIGKVFFTVDGEKVTELRTTTESFRQPLFPTIAANYEVSMSANLGQSPFKYAAANAVRIADPCFRRTTTAGNNHKAAFSEDSADLFSMGKINSQWLAELPPPTGGAAPSPPPSPLLPDPESDLFEIVLASSATS